MQEETPHFSTVSYNFRHRFTEETVDRVFAWILDEVAKAGYLSPKAVFIDGTHIKANANTKKQVKEQIPAAARHYAKELMEEVNADREAHDKKPFDDDNDPPASPRKHKDNTSKKKLARRKKQGFRSSVEVDGKGVKAVRECTKHQEIVTAQLPVVITVVKGEQEPRFETIRGRLHANRYEIKSLTRDELPVEDESIGLKGSATRVKRSFTPERHAECVWIKGESVREQAGKLYEALERANVI